MRYGPAPEQLECILIILSAIGSNGCPIDYKEIETNLIVFALSLTAVNILMPLLRPRTFSGRWVVVYVPICYYGVVCSSVHCTTLLLLHVQ